MPLASLCGLLAVLLGTPAPASAQRAGGKLMLFLFAAPMLLPFVGTLAAAFGLRATRAPLLWWFLCALLGLNSALLGGLLRLVPSEATGILFLLAQMGMASTMLFTLPVSVTESKAKLVLGRVPSVSAFGVLPGILVSLFFD